MPIYRRCDNCHQLYTGRRCPTCKKKQDRQYRQRTKERHELTRIYRTQLWAKCRRNVITRYYGYDIWLLAAGTVWKPERIIVHHIKERDEAPDLLYDLDNLITVSEDSHKEIHTYYATNKQYALDRIRKGIEEFHRMFD